MHLSFPQNRLNIESKAPLTKLLIAVKTKNILVSKTIFSRSDEFLLFLPTSIFARIHRHSKFSLGYTIFTFHVQCKKIVMPKKKFSQLKIYYRLIK